MSTASSFLAAMFMSLFVIYGFDPGPTLAEEETKDPRRAAPKACSSPSSARSYRRRVPLGS